MQMNELFIGIFENNHMKTKDYTHHIVGPFFVLLFVTQGIESETLGVPFLDAIIISLLIYYGVRFLYQWAYERGESGKDR